MQYNLIIDHEFESLMPSLSRHELKMLEHNLISEGCHDALIVWDNVIIDGHDRYRLCKKHGLSFRIQHRSFDSRDEAIVWLCCNQSGRRNLSVEMRRYLMGKRYIAQRRLEVGTPSERNRHKAICPQNVEEPRLRIRGVADQLCDEYKVSHSTVERCSKYAKALDRVASVNEALMPCILSGALHIKHDDLVGLSSLPIHQIDAVVANIPVDTPYWLTGEEIMSKLRKAPGPFVQPLPIREKARLPSIKDMPAHDPDAEISSLFLTIPSWRLSIQRVSDNSDMLRVSHSAKRSLRSALESLAHTVEQMLATIQED